MCLILVPNDIYLAIEITTTKLTESLKISYVPQNHQKVRFLKKIPIFAQHTLQLKSLKIVHSTP